YSQLDKPPPEHNSNLIYSHPAPKVPNKEFQRFTATNVSTTWPFSPAHSQKTRKVFANLQLLPEASTFTLR
ncbi:hypothetical protein TGAM01_v201730, partial [Trichoderma gamsii]